jgi:pimeloyl-ACP methyl ester carboxylesterase
VSRRSALWLLGGIALVLGVVLTVIDARLQDAGGWGILDFELAGSRSEAREIVADWGSKGHGAAQLSLWLDFLYLLAYGAFLTLAVAAVRDLAERQGWRRFASVGARLLYFPAAAAGLDAIEDVGLLLALGGHGGDFAPGLAAVCAVGKFALIGIALAYLLGGLVRRARERWRSATAVVLGAAALLLAAVVAVGVSATEETQPARAHDGQIIRLPGGDLHVVDTGPRGDAALVLLHGYTGSTRWWSRTAPLLARSHRTILVDLLGHGDSEKPRYGYEMPQQARLVDAALRRLGVRRAVVVGHSMGGFVAVSMAEQDARLVRGVVIVATPANRPEGPGPTGDRLGYMPVIGPALWKAVPDSFVRSKLKSAFADGVPVPDQFVRDTRSLTWTAYERSAVASRDFREESPPARRMARTGLPFLGILGSEDKRVKADSTRDWDTVPGGRVVRLAGVGHSPMWERPGTTGALIARFAAPLLR